MPKRSSSLLILLLLLAGSCVQDTSESGRTAEPGSERSGLSAADSSTSAAVTAQGEGAGAAPSAASSGTETSTAGAGAKDGSPPELSVAEFRKLVETLSEPDGDFFSDNYISNETSYLQATAELVAHARTGGAYLGVGPEQNFTYIAQTRPAMAFIVDIRRDNLVLHLLYKAIFDLARSRSEFLTLLVGRPYADQAPPDPSGDIEHVMAHAERLPAGEESFGQIHQRLRQQIEEGYGFALSSKDRRSLRQAHRSFFSGGLDIRFELREESHRRYPSLRELLAARDPADEHGGFLATESDFRFVQDLERSHRIVPVVGNFAGEHAVQAVASYLKQHRLQLSMFYVSNVEQYLLQDGIWWKWRRNIEALPTDDRSLFLRCYLDQGRRHPKQMKGHRTATVLQRVADFHGGQNKRPYRSMFKLSTAPFVPAPAAAGADGDAG